jgi:hypothetical protein
VHLLTAVRHLDTIATDIRRAETVRKDMETRGTLAALLALYGMTFSARGRASLVRTLCAGEHTDYLLALVHHSADAPDGKRDMKKSAIRGFASELLLLTIRSSADMAWLRRYGAQLLELGRSDEHSKLAEVAAWCGPLAALGSEEAFTEGAVAGLVGLVQRHLEAAGEEREAAGPGPDLVTATRILCSLVTVGETRQVAARRSLSPRLIFSPRLSEADSFPGPGSLDIHTQDLSVLTVVIKESGLIRTNTLKNTLCLKDPLHIVKRGFG